MRPTEPIDFTAQIEDIRDRYPEYWRSPEAQADALALWGGELGELETEAINLPGEIIWWAEVNLRPGANGLWAMSVSYHYGTGGRGNPVNQWNTKAWGSREAAFEAGIAELVKGYRRAREIPGLLSARECEVCTRMIEVIFEARQKRSQLSLF